MPVITFAELFTSFRKGIRNGNWKHLLEKREEDGAFTWATQLKHWLRDPEYIFWLGAVR